MDASVVTQTIETVEQAKALLQKHGISTNIAEVSVKIQSSWTQDQVLQSVNTQVRLAKRQHVENLKMAVQVLNTELIRAITMVQQDSERTSV